MTEQKQSTFEWVFWLKWIFASTLGWLFGWALLGEIGIGLVTGTLQWFILRELVLQAGWWILASALGWAGGLVLIVLVLPPEAGVLGAILVGAIIGAAQWLVLRRWVYGAGWWVPISALGWAAGLMGFLGIWMVGTLVGGVTGIPMELMMRNPRPDAMHTFSIDLIKDDSV